VIEEFLAELAALIEPVEVHFQWRPQPRDPSDEIVLEAAVNGRADALVTCNVADFAGAAERFRISVLRPGDLLKKVNHEQSSPAVDHHLSRRTRLHDQDAADGL
jgi:predicted nucleic acid-binding protein